MLYQSSRMRVECGDGIATLSMDAPGGNRLGLELLHEFRRALETVRKCRAAEVLVLRSAQAGVFLTGPSLNEYEQWTDPGERRTVARIGQEVLQQLSELSPEVPTIAYVDGDCRNAGLELALACDFRLAVARPATRIGFDHAIDGTLPCWGATQRLPRLVGPAAARDLLTRGSLLPARAAKQLGLVDHAFGPRPAKTELWWFIQEVRDGVRRPAHRRWWQRLRDEWAQFWHLLNPVPIDEPMQPVIMAMDRGWRYGLAEGYAAERTAFANEGLNPMTAGQRQLARQSDAWSRNWGDIVPPKRIGLQRLDGVGVKLAVAGLAAGGTVTVAEMTDDRPLRQALLRTVDQGWLTVLEAEQRLKQIGPGELDDCELVFITGTPEEQTARLLELDDQLPADVILAATAREVPLDRLEPQLHHPERIAALDVAMPAVVELLTCSATQEMTQAQLFRWLEQCGERPILRRPLVRPRLAAA